MILAIVAVGDRYIENCLPHLDRFKNYGYQIKILTDNPKSFIGYDVQLYENKIFSYFDKLIFSLRIVEKYKTDVLYIDADWIQNVNDNFIKEFSGHDNVLYYDDWEYVIFENCSNDFYWRDLLFYFNLNKISYNHLKLPLEWMFYFPNINNISDVLLDIEKIKPIFDWISTVVPSQYTGNGNGEGLGLSHVLDKNNIQLTKFDKILFNNIKESRKII
jgi:hypothetical protein